jgi:hypothetical protein
VYCLPWAVKLPDAYTIQDYGQGEPSPKKRYPLSLYRSDLVDQPCIRINRSHMLLTLYNNFHFSQLDICQGSKRRNSDRHNVI